MLDGFEETVALVLGEIDDCVSNSFWLRIPFDELLLVVLMGILLRYALQNRQ